ncbi:MAG: hypothetical protein VXW65_14660 [Pseudomonadota bacterium]|nr:hypothetical protein [Pseudomonadota bacterium]
MVTSNEATLHLLVAPQQQWSTLLRNLQQVWQSDDQLILMAQAIHGWQDPALTTLADTHAIGIYQADAEQLALPEQLPQHLQYVSTALWATWVLSFPRSITWR